ncbi:XrtA system polysaccharide chain length determinant [Lysobacter sp. D1-1-M9]|uniref:XrtA system polysaccharide chain length determinant n=1 Tax=Novilysobacter longmucuonensis TaxID=3098603 RepID=UPI002FC91D36
MVPLLPMAMEEGRRRPLLLAVMFATIALAALVLGAMAPKKFTSSSTVRVQENNIIEPVAERRSSSGAPVDHAGIAREIAFSRKVLDDVLEVGGWTAANPTPLEREKLRDQIMARTTIASPNMNPGLIKISYSDEDPQRAHQVTERLANAVIQENLQEREQLSRTAFQFIDEQTDQYHEKLTEAESELVAYYRANPDALPGSTENSEQRITELLRETDRARLEAVDQQAQAQALQSHLANVGSNGIAGARASQIGARLSELQSERDRLGLNYTDQHPDVVRIEHQIQDLETELQRELASPSRNPVAAVQASSSPVYSSISGQLAQARSRGAASSARLAFGEQLMAVERERNQRLLAMEGELAELTRTFETSRDMYRDLLERRENARMAMYLDAAHGDLSFRIQEPAEVPLQATGLRLMHIGAAGLLLAVAIPLALLFAWVRADPRVRSAAQIEQAAGLPVLASIPRNITGRRRKRSNKRLAMAAALTLMVPVAYTLALILR